MFSLIVHRWRWPELVVPKILNKSLAFIFIRIIWTIVLCITSTGHLDARPIITGEFILRAPCELQDCCVGWCLGACTGVVVNCPLLSTSQKSVFFCLRGCQKVLAMYMCCFPNWHLLIIPAKAKLPQIWQRTSTIFLVTYIWIDNYKSSISYHMSV